jgi:antitoxin MazE
MKLRIVRIGNSRGIRLPRPVLEQCGFTDSADLRVQRDRLVLSPSRPLRAGWEDAFRKGNATGDSLLIDGAPTYFDREEWTW